ncbi:hypothetical protein WR25_20617 isoform K [Diploscapter pachys]|uniref:ATP-grasp domain-containing protein n=1 Tax=Diploscapter pachys TaxID=2018661 RepID=A0A2A2KZI7_9BILA|nr:hypothetical protein WR25_20617 isoform A [Diploscapter pachys]PAV79349.1 hypothetical protein WR25_20617 isoform B [Diploscapter pachys]PAV79353.1 hypothetical protein WR25_20617 isoform F [Diploscapter pachys]PAV79358.1 hypothetical protein WR25_20617 isoform K [Diploscapter pachys]
MNFFKRKFSFHDDDPVAPMEDVAGASSPPSSFSFQAIANKVSSTISAPTSPARTGESLAAALERSMQDRSREQPLKDAKVLLVVDSPQIDWSKYFRVQNEVPIRVEQADFPELDLMCTEHICTVEITQTGRDPRAFTPSAAFIGPGASKCPEAKAIIRCLIAAHIPLLNSYTSVVAFLDRCNLQPASAFPIVVIINEGSQGMGKVKVNSHEEMCDIEGMLQMVGEKGELEVEVEPFVDVKYDLHVQKIGDEFKSFIRRGISRSWKSNVGSNVLEQIPSIERHKNYIRAIEDHVGPMSICSIDILVSKEGREFVHGINDVLAYFGESQEDDRRATAHLLRNLVLSGMHLHYHRVHHVHQHSIHGAATNGTPNHAHQSLVNGNHQQQQQQRTPVVPRRTPSVEKPYPHGRMVDGDPTLPRPMAPPPPPRRELPQNPVNGQTTPGAAIFIN